jgi:hypothetical protein
VGHTPGVSRYEIVTERTTFGVTTRPGMPGVGATVSGVTGHVIATIDGDGVADLDQPVSGSFHLTVGDLATGNQLVTSAVEQFLGSETETAVAGSILEARPRPDGRIDLVMTVEIRGRTVRLIGAGRLTPRADDADGQLDATGATLVDPRSFGLPLPPLVNLMVQVRWRVTLTEIDGPAQAG